MNTKAVNSSREFQPVSILKRVSGSLTNPSFVRTLYLANIDQTLFFQGAALDGSNIARGLNGLYTKVTSHYGIKES